MKTANYLALTFIVLTTAASATVYSDDFESYPVGYDIADSPEWGDSFSEGMLLIGEEISNKYI
jgi:hypothetical protein